MQEEMLSIKPTFEGLELQSLGLWEDRVNFRTYVYISKY
jgi:hypothetical protein